MKQRLVFLVSIVLAFFVIAVLVEKFSAIQLNPRIKKKAATLQGVSQSTQTAPESLPSTLKTAEGPPASAPQPAVEERPVSDFIEETLRVIQAYRESNRGFLQAEGVAPSLKARHQFERVHSMAFTLQDGAVSQTEVKELLMEASQFRVQAADLILKIYDEPSSPLTGWRWERSLSALSQANDRITQAAQRLVNLIDFHGTEIGEEVKGGYLRSLGEAVKGILVVTRNSP